jgi:hypothetical protein
MPEIIPSQLSNYDYARKEQQGALKYQLDFGEVIEHIRMYLEGYYRDERKGEYIALNLDEAGNAIPLMNKTGIALVMRNLVSLSHKGTVLANITHEESTEWAKTIHRSVAKAVFIHGDEIGVAACDLPEYTRTISLNIYNAFTRAVGGDAATQLNQIVTVHEEKSDRDKKVF